MRGRTAAILAGVLAMGLARDVRAQGVAPPPPYGEYRLDAISGRGTAVQVGGGVSAAAGLYVRIAVLAAAGETWRDGAGHLSGRTDVIGRFQLDPMRETPVALSLGGGVSVPYETGRRVRPFLTAVVDLEGRRAGRFTPALQVGLGGGARVGLVLRTSPPRRR